MKSNFTDLLVCPGCRNSMELEVYEEQADEISNGNLICAVCDRKYPIKNAPRFVSSDNYAHSFSIEWNTFKRVQLDSESGTTISRDRFVSITGVEPEELRGKRVLEIGCGAGRFIEVLARCGVDVIGVDLSTAVEASYDNVGVYRGVHLAQADLFDLPFKPNTFDFIYSIGVLMHTPAPEIAFQRLVPYLKPGGQIAIWVYRRNIPRWLPTPLKIYRLITSRMPPLVLLKALRAYVPFALASRRLPLIGKPLSLIFPVADYGARYPLSESQVKEWALLDAFDGFATRYVRGYTFQEVEQWFLAAGLTNITRGEVATAIRGERVIETPSVVENQVS